MQPDFVTKRQLIDNGALLSEKNAHTSITDRPCSTVKRCTKPTSTRDDDDDEAGSSESLFNVVNEIQSRVAFAAHNHSRALTTATGKEREDELLI